MDRCIQEYKEAEEMIREFDKERGNEDYPISELMVDFRKNRLDDIAELFIEKTKDRNPHRCNKKGGYKKWEHEMMELCGYEYIVGEGWVTIA